MLEFVFNSKCTTSTEESPLVGMRNITSLSFFTRVTLLRCLSLPWPPVPLCVKLATFLHKEVKIVYIQTIIIIILLLCVYVHLYTCACFSSETIHPTERKQWPEGNFGELVLSFQLYMGSGDKTRATRSRVSTFIVEPPCKPKG